MKKIALFVWAATHVLFAPRDAEAPSGSWIEFQPGKIFGDIVETGSIEIAKSSR
jgi:hypothetical protein